MYVFFNVFIVLLYYSNCCMVGCVWLQDGRWHRIHFSLCETIEFILICTLLSSGFLPTIQHYPKYLLSMSSNQKCHMRCVSPLIIITTTTLYRGTWSSPWSWTLKGSCARQPSPTTTKCASSDGRATKLPLSPPGPPPEVRWRWCRTSSDEDSSRRAGAAQPTGCHHASTHVMSSA